MQGVRSVFRLLFLFFASVCLIVPFSFSEKTFFTPFHCLDSFVNIR